MAGILLVTSDVSDDVTAQPGGLDPQLVARGSQIQFAGRVARTGKRLDFTNALPGGQWSPVEQLHLSPPFAGGGRVATGRAGS
jgi:hypothetical protein